MTELGVEIDRIVKSHQLFSHLMKDLIFKSLLIVVNEYCLIFIVLKTFKKNKAISIKWPTIFVMLYSHFVWHKKNKGPWLQEMFDSVLFKL